MLRRLFSTDPEPDPLATRMSPPLGRSLPIISRSSVDLPEPDPPRMTSVSPWRTSRLILFRTVRVPKTLVTSRTWIATPLMRSGDGAGPRRSESGRSPELLLHSYENSDLRSDSGRHGPAPSIVSMTVMGRF